MRPFRFDKRLIEIPHFKNHVRVGWNKEKPGQKSTILDRVRTCKQSMATLKHRSNMNSHIRINQLQTALDRSMSSLLRAERLLIPQIQRDLTKAYNDEEKYWQQKSRNSWMKEGDRNTGFFHACTKTRFTMNRITSIYNEEGRMFKGNQEIDNHAQRFFTNVFTSSGRSVSTIDFANFKSTVTPHINSELTKDFTDSEIFDAICQIGDDKAPGPDGLTARFYKSCCDIVSSDVIQEVKHYFRTSSMRNSLNHTNICMIPKITNPQTLLDYQPITLCNVLYKIISKCLVGRLKSHLDAIVFDSQAAFIPGD